MTDEGERRPRTAGRAAALLLLAIGGGAVTAGAGCCGDDNSGKAVGTLTNDTGFYIHVFAGEATQIYVAPGAQISLDFTSTSLVEVAFSPGQDAPAGIGGRARVSCCCGGGATSCDTTSCGTLDVTASAGSPLSLRYTPPSCGGGGSCPYVYAHNAYGPVPQGEVLSAALFAGAARGDVLPLPDATIVDGAVRVTFATALREIDVLTRAALLTIEHDADVSLATDADGSLAPVSVARPPVAATSPSSSSSGARANLLPLVAARDGRVWVGRFVNDELRDTLALRFAPPPAPRARLVLVLRNTRPAEKSLQAFLAELGPGFPGLLRRLSALPRYRTTLENTLADSGLSLGVTLSQPGHAPQRRRVMPVGSLAARAIALTFDALAPGEPVEVTLDALPGAWEVDAAALGAPADDRLAVAEIAPAELLSSDGTSPVLGDETPYRQRQGQFLDLVFRVPAAPGRAATRSFALAVRGHYELVPGDGVGVDWGLLAWRTLVGKGAFARYLRGERAEPHWAICPKRIVRDLVGAGVDLAMSCGGAGDNEARP